MKILKNVCLPIVIGLVATQVSVAAPKLFSYGKGKDFIHFTHVKLINHSQVETDAYLFQGTNANGACQGLQEAGEFHGIVFDGSNIAAPSELFTGELTKDSCAIEKFTVDGKESSLTYNLINDGHTVTAAEPRDQDITID